MTRLATHRPLAPSAVALAVAALVATATWPSRAETPPPSNATPGQPDESVLGTVLVTGGAETPLPKLAVMPVITTGDADTTTQLVVRRDLDLSGQFEVVSDDTAPKGIFDHDTAVDVAAWRAKGVEIVVKAVANKLPSGRIELLGGAFLLSHGAAPVFQNRLETSPTALRLTAHRLADAIIGALTGLPGGFASHMAYSGRVDRNRQIFTIDADGFNLKAVSPVKDTALAPVFGPGGEIYYALSHDMAPFVIVHGADAKPLTLGVKGSVFGLDFSSDGKKLAVAIAAEQTSRIYIAEPDGFALTATSTAPLANHPVFGPAGRIAYVAGGTTGQRVYVDGKPISPHGFNASAPTFCNTPNGVMVIFTVGVGKGADLVATDVRGGSIQRLTQDQGANSYPACSPDGRLVAFFSTRSLDKGPGLYIAPLTAPGRAKRISAELGESLRWQGIPP